MGTCHRRWLEMAGTERVAPLPPPRHLGMVSKNNSSQSFEIDGSIGFKKILKDCNAVDSGPPRSKHGRDSLTERDSWIRNVFGGKPATCSNFVFLKRSGVKRRCSESQKAQQRHKNFARKVTAKRTGELMKTALYSVFRCIP